MFFKVKMKKGQYAPLYDYVIVEGYSFIDAVENAESLPFVFGEPIDETEDKYPVIENPLKEPWPVFTEQFFDPD